MESVTREETVDELYATFDKKNSVSREAFERNGQIGRFVKTRLEINGQFRIFRESSQATTMSPDRCTVCSSQMVTFSPASHADGVDAATEHYFRTEGFLFEDSSILVPIASSHQVRRCSTCCGSGTIECSYSEGTGLEVCRHCKGTGQNEIQKSCQVCHGSFPDCSQCEGTGSVYIIEPCSSCHGDGTEFCTSCRGDGAVDCEKCSGTGMVHATDALSRTVEVDWTVVGLPEWWGTTRETQISTSADLDLPYDVFALDWQEEQFLTARASTVPAGVLEIKYGTTDYHVMLVKTDDHSHFIYNPETGTISTSLRRKLHDLRGRLLPRRLR